MLDLFIISLLRTLAVRPHMVLAISSECIKENTLKKLAASYDGIFVNA